MSCIVEEIALWFLPSSAAALLAAEVPSEVPTPAQDPGSSAALLLIKLSSFGA